LLDQLHGAAAPGASALAAKPAPAPAASDEISEDEFEALLDQLHGKAAPGANPVPAAAPAAATAVATPPRAPARPAPKAAPAAPPHRAGQGEAEHTVRVDTRRLDAIVNLIGELVLARNRLKTLRTRLRDDELDRAVASLDVATARLQSAVMRTRMQPVGKVFSRFPMVARDVARSLSKEVELEMVGAE